MISVCTEITRHTGALRLLSVLNLKPIWKWMFLSHQSYQQNKHKAIFMTIVETSNAQRKGHSTQIRIHNLNQEMT